MMFIWRGLPLDVYLSAPLNISLALEEISRQNEPPKKINKIIVKIIK